MKTKTKNQIFYDLPVVGRTVGKDGLYHSWAWNFNTEKVEWGCKGTLDVITKQRRNPDLPRTTTKRLLEAPRAKAMRTIFLTI